LEANFWRDVGTDVAPNTWTKAGASRAVRVGQKCFREGR
jgi:hypothetical protein